MLNTLLAKLREKYEISAQVIERPGDELSFLKRTHVLHADGRMTIQTHQKHVTQMCVNCTCSVMFNWGTSL